MYISFLRSSSYGAYSFCQQKYFFSNVLGIREQSNQKAAKGTITHKALELLARRKLAEQNNQIEVVDDESGEIWNIVDLTPDKALDFAWDFYTMGVEAHHTWKEADKRDASKWMWVALNSNLSPLKQNVVYPEKYFDYTMPFEWAKYDYSLGNERLKGQLSIKGTVDLIVKLPGDEVYELLDWKTGACKDWASGKVKDYESFQHDAQLLLYYYALKKAILPQAKQILITIYYLANEGPFTMSYDEASLREAEELIKRRFLEIKRNESPRLINDWRCSKLCQFGKTFVKDGRTQCQEMRDNIVQLGVDRCAQVHGDLTKLSSYGSGGGSTKRDLPE